MTKRGQEFLAKLTQRQREIVPLVAGGLTNHQIAERIGIGGEQVIKNYLRLVYAKAGVATRIELMVFCFYHGIVQCPCAARAEKMAVAKAS